MPGVPGKKQPRSKKSAYLPDTMWAELEAIAEAETTVRKGTAEEEDISVNWILEVFLRWAIDDYHRLKQHGATAKKKA